MKAHCILIFLDVAWETQTLRLKLKSLKKDVCKLEQKWYIFFSQAL